MGGSIYFITENTALGITLASNVSLIICTAPILTAFLSLLFYRQEKIKPNLIYGSVMALIGVAFVVFNGSFLLKINPLGDMLTLIAALMWAFYCLILKQMGNRYPTLLITRKVFFYGLVTLTPMFLIHPLNTDTTILFNPIVAANLLFLGVIASMLCYIMWNTAVKELGPFRTANYIYIVPLVTLITSAIVIDEIIDGRRPDRFSVYPEWGVYCGERVSVWKETELSPKLRDNIKTILISVPQPPSAASSRWHFRTGRCRSFRLFQIFRRWPVRIGWRVLPADVRLLSCLSQHLQFVIVSVATIISSEYLTGPICS